MVVTGFFVLCDIYMHCLGDRKNVPRLTHRDLVCMESLDGLSPSVLEFQCPWSCSLTASLSKGIWCHV